MSQLYNTDEEIITAFGEIESSQSDKLNYILKPISVKANFKTTKHFDKETPKYWVQLIVDDFSLNLKKKELLNLIKIMDFITKYRKFLDSYNKTLKYKFLRPQYSILDKEVDEKCTEYNINPNAKQWWKYSIECILRTIQMKNGAPNQFKLSSVATKAIGKQYKHYFSKIFTKKQEVKERVESTSGGEIPKDAEDMPPSLRELSIIEHNALDSKERHQYYYILTALDEKTLKEWTSEVVKKHHENFKEAESKRTSSSSMWSMFSWVSGGEEEAKDEVDQSEHEFAPKTDFHISEEEIKEIDKAVQDAIEETNEEDPSDVNLMLQVEYKCLKGEINVEDDCEKEKSGILFKYEKCCFEIKKNFSREFIFTTSMKNLSVDLFFQMPHNPQLIHLPLFRTKSRLFEKPKAVKQKEEDEDDSEDIYDITILRNKSGSKVDFEFYFTVKPIYFYYRAYLIKIIKSFTAIGMKSSEELKVNAWDKFQEVKDKSQEKIQSALFKTTNIMNGSILDPKLILPFTQNNDMNKPAYVLCLGNLQLKANKQNLDEQFYNYLNVSIKGTQIQYFESLRLWQRYERDCVRVSLAGDELFNGLNKSVFNVIEELDMFFKFGIRKRLLSLTDDKNLHAQFVIEGKVSDIKVNMTSERYNSILNFNKMIEMTSKNFTSKIILHEKEDIMNMATYTGFLRKRGDTLQYWRKQYAVLSGAYLYFYSEDVDNADTYESWFYIKDSIVGVYEEADEDMPNVFFIDNYNSTVFLYVSDEETMKEWIKTLRERIYEISSIAQDLDLDKNKKTEVDIASIKHLKNEIPELKIFDINLDFENVEYNMIDDDFAKFLSFNISEMSLTSETTTRGDIAQNNEKVRSYDNKYSHCVAIGIKKFKINDRINDIVILESFNQVNATVNILNKNSKIYEGDNIVINFEFDLVNVNFVPKPIKWMITFFKRMDYEGEQLMKSPAFGKGAVLEERKEESKYENDLKPLDPNFKLQSTESKTDRSSNFDADDYMNVLGSKSILKVNLNIQQAKLILINPIKMTPFVYMDLTTVLPKYELFQGFHSLKIAGERLKVRAESPIFGTFDVIDVNCEEISQPLNQEDAEPPVRLNCKFYKDEHLRPEQKISNNILIEIDELLLFYQHENVMRIKTYFMDQFLDSLTGEKKPVDIRDSTFGNASNSFRNINYENCDLLQPDRYGHVEFILNHPQILLKDRPHFNEAFVFDIQKLVFINSIELSKGRWYRFPEKLCKEQYFKVLIEDTCLYYNQSSVSNVFDLEVGIKDLTDSPIKNAIPHEELDKALHITIKSKNLLKLSLTQHTYTYLLR